MAPELETLFKHHYETHLKLKGLRPKTIEAHAWAIRRLGEGLRLEVGDIGAKNRLWRIMLALLL